MIRLLALSLFLSATAAFAQQPSEEQQCQIKCGQAMNTCMMPCLGSDPKEASKPENRDKTAACVRGCATEQQPCLAACGKPKKKAK